MVPVRGRITACVGLAGLAVAAGGCGGSSDGGVPAEELRSAIDADADGITELLQNLSSITTTLSGMANAVGTAFDQVSNVTGGQELEGAFADADSCLELGSTR